MGTIELIVYWLLAGFVPGLVFFVWSFYQPKTISEPLTALFVCPAFGWISLVLCSFALAIFLTYWLNKQLHAHQVTVIEKLDAWERKEALKNEYSADELKAAYAELI